jgi:hypothetical protein
MDKHNQTFIFSISSTSNTVNNRSELWNHPLPADRFAGDANDGKVVTIGDYFTAASRFLSENAYTVIICASMALTDRTTCPADIKEINICLVKHGAFYHPSMVTVSTKNSKRFCLALNLASSPEGIQIMDREFDALEKLSSNTDRIPRLFGKGGYSTENGIPVSMFAAEWFDGFYEFHVSRCDDSFKIIVWDTDAGHYYMDEKESMSVYRQVAEILTICYDFNTGEQIQPWHHAAGDFIVKKNQWGL